MQSVCCSHFNLSHSYYVAVNIAEQKFIMPLKKTLEISSFTGSYIVIDVGNTEFDISQRSIRLRFSHRRSNATGWRVYAAPWMAGGEIHFQNRSSRCWSLFIANRSNNHRCVHRQNARLFLKKGEETVGCHSAGACRLHGIYYTVARWTNSRLRCTARWTSANLFE